MASPSCKLRTKEKNSKEQATGVSSELRYPSTSFTNGFTLQLSIYGYFYLRKKYTYEWICENNVKKCVLLKRFFSRQSVRLKGMHGSLFSSLIFLSRSSLFFSTLGVILRPLRDFQVHKGFMQIIDKVFKNPVI